ncbi:hypothetical protein [uncultured Lacinutrix sp.]|uniref:hypothetical protein n=1 Tax=uncultured Lacinutrix sp. TaxID=574032 RepID=UPI0026030185|nr:hypothetical protein [uncultured Lacinutrix sp.]
MYIVFLVFGKDYINYQQALFSMFTFLSQMKEEDKIIVLTDHPDYFNIIKDRIIISKLNESTLTEWKGDHQFFWRIKIKALQLIAKQWNDKPFLYLDADTFLFEDFNSIKTKLSQGYNLMHLNEGKLSELQSKTEKLMWHQLKNTSHGSINIDSNTCMWNAGAIAVSNDRVEVLQLALDICDSMCMQQVTPRLIEQLAFSIALQTNNKLEAIDNCVGHYWGNKKQWNEKISEFFSYNLMTSLSINEQIKKTTTIKFNAIPVIIKVPNTRLRLIKKVTHWFPNKYQTFIRKE